MMDPKEVETAIADARRFIDLAEEYVKEFYSYKEAHAKGWKEFPEAPWRHLPADRRYIRSGLARAQSIVLWRQLAKMRRN